MDENTTYIFHAVSEEQDLARLRALEEGLNGPLGLLPPLPEELFTKQCRGLDIGSGSGILTTEIAIAHPHLSMVGIDINRARVLYAREQARLKGIGNVSFVEGNAL